MSDQPETLAAILAEMRDRAGDALDSGYTGEARDMLSLADRIEAAAEREREIARDLGRIDRESDNMARAADALEKAFAPGNAAAMREAVERAIDAIQTMIALYDEEHTSAVQIGATWKRSDTSVVNAIVEQARAALAAPARNCDRFATAEEAVAAFADHLRAFENAHGINSEHPDHPVQVPVGAFAWLFAPAKGGDHA